MVVKLVDIELDVLKNFVGDIFWNQIASITNHYTRQNLLADGDNNSNKKWIDITSDELKVYFVIVILMS